MKKEVLFKGILTYNRVEEFDYRGRKLQTPVNKLSFKLEKDEMKKAINEILKAGDDMKASFDLNSNFTPKFLKEEGHEYITLKSIYHIPCKVDNRADANESDVNVGAECLVKISVDDKNRIYPVSVVVEKNGADYNPFAGM